MTRFLIGLADAGDRTVTAAGYRLDDGYFHFTDELGGGIFSVSASSVTGIEPMGEAGTEAQPSDTRGKSGPVSDVLVLRVWSEPQHVEPLRVRITTQPEGADGPVAAYASGTEQVLVLVGTWLDEFSRRQA